MRSFADGFWLITTAHLEQAQGNQIQHGAVCSHLKQLHFHLRRAEQWHPRPAASVTSLSPTPTEPLTDQGSRLLYLLLTPGSFPSPSLSGSFLVALMKNSCVTLKSCQLLLLGIKSSLCWAETQESCKLGSEEWLVRECLHCKRPPKHNERAPGGAPP